MQININPEVRHYKEALFFGLTTRQFLCSLAAMLVAVGTYFLTKNLVGREVSSWLCMLLAAPFATAGFFSYQGMPFEKFVVVWCKSQILCAGRRLYRTEHPYEIAYHHLQNCLEKQRKRRPRKLKKVKTHKEVIG